MVAERPLRILMVLESAYEAGGGAEAQVRTLAQRMTALGHQVTVMTPRFGQWQGPNAQRFPPGVLVGRIGYPEKKGIGAAVLNIRMAAFLWQHRKKYDAWHVHIGHNLGAVTCLVGSFVRKPVVVKISGWWELEKGLLNPKGGLFTRAARACLKRASTTQAISTRIATELERAGFRRDRILNLPNAVDLGRFDRHQAKRVPGEPFVVVYIGRLELEKDIPTLIEAWAKAFGKQDDVRLKLIGRGDLEAELKALVKKRGVEHTVEFLGFSKNVAEALANAKAHAGVLSSRIEGLSNVLLELMSSGLPTLASKVSGSEDFVITGKNGWLFDVGDVETLTKHLRSAYEMSPEALEEMGRQARAEVQERAALDTVVGQLLSLYRKGR